MKVSFLISLCFISNLFFLFPPKSRVLSVIPIYRSAQVSAVKGMTPLDALLGSATTDLKSFHSL